VRGYTVELYEDRACSPAYCRCPRRCRHPRPGSPQVRASWPMLSQPASLRRRREELSRDPRQGAARLYGPRPMSACWKRCRSPRAAKSTAAHCRRPRRVKRAMNLSCPFR
jgi:hypothetical protein